MGFRHTGRRVALTSSVAILAVACDNPSWKHDHYIVEGALMGSTCRATIDGRPFVGDTTGMGEKISIQHDDVSEVGLPEGQGVKTILCRGLALQFLSPAGTYPAPTRLRVGQGATFETGIVDGLVDHSGIDAGRWPLALTGVHLEPTDGFLQLDEMTDTTARGTFRMIMRRRANGE